MPRTKPRFANRRTEVRPCAGRVNCHGQRRSAPDTTDVSSARLQSNESRQSPHARFSVARSSSRTLYCSARLSGTAVRPARSDDRPAFVTFPHTGAGDQPPRRLSIAAEEGDIDLCIRLQGSTINLLRGHRLHVKARPQVGGALAHPVHAIVSRRCKALDCRRSLDLDGPSNCVRLSPVDRSASSAVAEEGTRHLHGSTRAVSARHGVDDFLQASHIDGAAIGFRLTVKASGR